MIFPEGVAVFGDLTYRDKSCPKEGAEQVTFFNQLRKHYPDTFGMTAVHTRNEGRRTMAQIQKEKAEGLTTGTPDIAIPGNPSFLCELKRQDHTESKWQPGQQEYLVASGKQGAFVCVALGWKAAMEAFEHWRDHVLRPA